MPQQHRAVATRDAILRAAAEEFDRLGYEGAALSAVLDRGGVTKGAFYFHFASKEALAAVLVRLQEELWPRLAGEWRARGLDPLSTAVGLVQDAAERLSRDVVLRAGVRLAADRELDHPGLAASHLRWEAVVGELLGDARAEGLLLAGVDPAAAARALCSAALGARLISVAASRCADYPERMREVWRLVLPGLAAPESRAAAERLLDAP
ncbi:ScbR family autoregulator-binding transcription factor [Saccharothrix sp. Mg75]|uniref:ScbR family autoregulator-binding transcription factor n=1 Tax=Saccharothrix sp. Mg75 TaxID=3445357 RepID=UPI003EEB4C5E